MAIAQGKPTPDLWNEVSGLHGPALDETQTTAVQMVTGREWVGANQSGLYILGLAEVHRNLIDTSLKEFF